MQTRSFTASSVYSKKSRRSCDSGLVARHKDGTDVSPRFYVASNGTGELIIREAKAEYMWFANERIITNALIEHGTQSTWRIVGFPDKWFQCRNLGIYM